MSQFGRKRPSCPRDSGTDAPKPVFRGYAHEHLASHANGRWRRRTASAAANLPDNACAMTASAAKPVKPAKRDRRPASGSQSCGAMRADRDVRLMP
ncbi:hypothetical protein GCM10027081_52630 [Cupriavidus yeoncheonensis]